MCWLARRAKAEPGLGPWGPTPSRQTEAGQASRRQEPGQPVCSHLLPETHCAPGPVDPARRQVQPSRARGRQGDRHAGSVLSPRPSAPHTFVKHLLCAGVCPCRGDHTRALPRAGGGKHCLGLRALESRVPTARQHRARLSAGAAGNREHASAGGQRAPGSPAALGGGGQLPSNPQVCLKGWGQGWGCPRPRGPSGRRLRPGLTFLAAQGTCVCSTPPGTRRPSREAPPPRLGLRAPWSLRGGGATGQSPAPGSGDPEPPPG